MSDAITADEFAAQLSQAAKGEQPQNADSPPDEEVADDSQDQPEDHEPDDSAQAEDDGEGQEEQPPAADSPEDRVIKWKTAGGEQFEATEKELQAGYMRDADYRQKTQAVADERKQVQQLAQQQVQEIEAVREEYGQLYAVQSELKQYGAVNWAQLQADDPQAYQHHITRLLLLQNQEKDVIVSLNAKRQEMAQKAQQQQQTDWQEANEKAVQELAAHIKGFDSDAGVRDKAVRQMTTAGRAYGFTAEELGQLKDGRSMKVLYDAAQWRALQAEKPQAVKKVAAAPVKAPVAQRSAPTKTEQLAKSVLGQKSISHKDFAALLSATRRK